MEKNVEIDQELCTGCGACVSMCPARILYLDAKTGTAKVTDEKVCDRLAGCVRVCPTGAIKVKRAASPFSFMTR
jgi:NAD-dependent dihydropyrimidine dehydrogenase PreA subunit